MTFIKSTIFLICVHFMLVKSKDEKYVDISLDAKWQQTPIIFEASEYIAEKSNADFWKFIEGIQEQTPFNSDKESYDAIIKTASSILSETELDALKFSLSIRAYSPRVQFFQQVAQDLHSNCKLFFQISDRGIYCNLDEAIEKVQSSDSDLAIQAFDHVYPDSEDNKHLIIVYGDVTSQQFHNAHTQIKSKVKETNLKYVLRHRYEVKSSSKVRLSGYGVELAVKSTEYKAVDDQKVTDSKKKEKVVDENSDEEVEGFLFKKLRELHPNLVEQLDQLKSHLKESNKELAPLRVWQLQDLSFQAGQRVVSASSQNVLKVLKDLSQNVPMVARSLVKTSVSDDMMHGIKANQEEFQRIGVAPGEAAMFINGIELGIDELDVFKLLKLIKAETSTMSKLNAVNLEPEKIGSVLALNTRPDEEGLIVDMRSESVQWINDLENDQRYSYWPSNIQEMLRPTFPGMLRYIARNIFHVVAYIDPMTKEGKNLFLSFNDLVENSVPARFGIVFVVSGSPTDTADGNPGAALTRAFSFVKSDRGLSDAFTFLSTLYRKAGSNMPSSQDVISLFTSWFGKSEADENLGADSDYDDLRRVSKKVFDSLGLKSLPNVLVNGQQLSSDELSSVESATTEKMLHQTPALQQAIYMGHHYSYPSIYDYVMSQPNVVNRLNKIIQTLDKKFINAVPYDSHDLQDVTLLSNEQAVGALMNQAKYFVQDKGITMWVVANAETDDGKKLIKNALQFVQKQKNSRVSIILHNDDTEGSSLNWNDALEIVFGLRQKLISGVAKLICKLLEQDSSVSDVIKEEQLLKLSAGITGINKKKLVELLSSTDALKQAKSKIQKNSALVKKAFAVKDQDNIVMANGRILGPLKGDDIFMVEDFELLQNFENSRCGYKITELVDKMSLPQLPVEGHDKYRSDIVLRISSILSEREDHKRTTLSYKEDKHSVVHLMPPKKTISFDIEAILDPLSKGAQKLAPILMVLHEAFNVNLRIFLNCKAKHSEMPVNRFYQYVLQPELTFDKEGELLSDQSAIFTNLPHSALLTLIMDTPISWMIEAVGSNQDLDNIHLSQANGVVYGDFELEHIIIEGHCSDSETHQPPRGLQFILGNDDDPELFDTIVMANLGYFQLKAFPGAFILQLRDGRSSQIYQIDSLEGGQIRSSGQNYTIIVDDFGGRFLRTKVKRRPGQETADLLGGEGGSEGDFGGIWDSIASYVKREKSTKNTDGKIHIFTVATGLLYERFLRIMMLSVLNHTKTPVKFWFLKNYLSSGFTQFLPHYAKHYGFEYELVQYQWPKWLNGQTEKQRIIWGYKILFLDVLFPLNLERIIFVDADQIVRADLKELMDMDLDGAPYAYTPFCNDRPEVEGFRFWNQGYWRNHLAGRPYHISALYVVDLKRFRRIAAGDRLRGQYQGLSQDPNSLANLDQDLPNNMIHQVQIKSLPQEWLWCETWCSDESKERAKTIDMCNNPQTKEPKLQRAMRIAPEWSVYDEVIRKLQENILKNITEVEPAALPIKVEL